MPILITYLYIVFLYLCGYAFALDNAPLVDLIIWVSAVLVVLWYTPYALIIVPGSGLIIFGISLVTFAFGTLNSSALTQARRASRTNQSELPKK